MLRVRPIHHGASGAVLAYLTDYLTKAAGEPPGQWAGRQAGALGLVGEVRAEQLEYVDTEGLTTAVFRQSTSRADDPQLHSHVVISSKVRAPDGRWRALDAPQLMKHQSTFGRVYQSVLRAAVTHRYDVGWTEVVNGQAEIAGIPAELLEVFSKRADQIGHELADRIDAFPDQPLVRLQPRHQHGHHRAAGRAPG